MANPQTKNILKQILLWLVSLVVVFCVAVSIYVELDPYNCRIAPNVFVGGLEIGDMTLREARRTLTDASERVLETTVLMADLPEETLSLSPSDTGVRLKILAVLLDAYGAGRHAGQPHSLGLQPYLELNTAYLRDVLAAYAAEHDTDLTPSRYRLQGTAPDLSVEAENPSPQTLELTMGLPTARFDQEDAYQQILAVYDTAFSAAARGEYRVTDCFRVDILEEPEPPDLQAVYEAVFVAPVDDSLDMDTYAHVPGAYGYRFDPEEAGKQIAAAGYGECVSIPMEFQEPEIFGGEVYFRDVLGYCETPHTEDENRNNNLRQACAAMDGLILQPGEVFSYNDTLGPRTKERGYLRAGAYSGWTLVQSYGGGICQGSSTIYCAALYADLEIVHRRNHGYKVGYIDAGLDATVNWGGPDFQFRNSTHFPIKIAAEVSDGYVKVTILGTEERDYYVEMETETQWGSGAIYARSYKCKYDRQTGELISRELEAKSNYAI